MALRTDTHGPLTAPPTADQPMDVTALSTFLAIARTGSFSLAGSDLHLTQPAVSKRIATLEDQLGVRLFDRIGRRVSLT